MARKMASVLALAALLGLSALSAAEASAAAPRLERSRKLLQVSRAAGTPTWRAQQAALLHPQAAENESGQRVAEEAAAAAARAPPLPMPGNSGWSALYPNVPGNTNRAWRMFSELWPGKRASPPAEHSAPGMRKPEAGFGRAGGPAGGAAAVLEASKQEYPNAVVGPNAGGAEAPLYWR